MTETPQAKDTSVQTIRNEITQVNNPNLIQVKNINAKIRRQSKTRLQRKISHLQKVWLKTRKNLKELQLQKEECHRMFLDSLNDSKIGKELIDVADNMQRDLRNETPTDTISHDIKRLEAYELLYNGYSMKDEAIELKRKSEKIKWEIEWKRKREQINWLQAVLKTFGEIKYILTLNPQTQKEECILANGMIFKEE